MEENISLGITFHGVGDGTADSVLSEVYHSLHSAFLPFYAYLLGIRSSGNPQARPGERASSRRLANTEMQSMGWQWL